MRASSSAGSNTWCELLCVRMLADLWALVELQSTLTLAELLAPMEPAL